MSEPFEYDVFLSHSSKDKPTVRALAERLRDDGLRVWLDEWAILPGDNIPLAIEHGIQTSRILILFMSANAFGSDWVHLERHAVLFRDPANRNRRFIPLRLDDAKIPDLIAQFAYLDWSNPNDEVYRRLLAVCRNASVANSKKENLHRSNDKIALKDIEDDLLGNEVAQTNTRVVHSTNKAVPKKENGIVEGVQKKDKNSSVKLDLKNNSVILKGHTHSVYNGSKNLDTKTDANTLDSRCYEKTLFT